MFPLPQTCLIGTVIPGGSEVKDKGKLQCNLSSEALDQTCGFNHTRGLPEIKLLL